MTRAVVVGAGHIARQHLRCLAQLPNAEVVGVCDLSPAMVRSAAEMLGVSRWFLDYDEMLAETNPEVVHVTTPAPTHLGLARKALDVNAHVIVEKPIASAPEQLTKLLARAKIKKRYVVENHNYLFNDGVQQLLARVSDGTLGDITHVEVSFCLNIDAPGSRFSDPNLSHPSHRYPGGAISDFLTHLAYLAWVFVGPHESVRTAWSQRNSDSPLAYDEFRALAKCRDGTALLSFSSQTQPDAFFVSVHGTRARAVAHLFEPRLTIERLRPGGPVMPILNAFDVGRSELRGALRSFKRKLGGGPGAYEGLWELVRRTYAAVSEQTEPPVSPAQVLEVNRWVDDLTRPENVF